MIKELIQKDIQYLKKQYIKDKIHLSELQDKYHLRLTEKGYDLKRDIKGSNAKHQKTKIAEEELCRFSSAKFFIKNRAFPPLKTLTKCV